MMPLGTGAMGLKRSHHQGRTKVATLQDQCVRAQSECSNELVKHAPKPALSYFDKAMHAFAQAAKQLYSCSPATVYLHCRHLCDML